MAFSILISDEAKSDIENSFLYFRVEVSKKVGDDFIKDFRNSIKVIPKNPFLEFGMILSELNR